MPQMQSPCSVTSFTKAFKSSANYTQSGEFSTKSDVGDAASRIGRKASFGQLQRVGRCRGLGSFGFGMTRNITEGSEVVIDPRNHDMR
jgi:hypothetical protein